MSENYLILVEQNLSIPFSGVLSLPMKHIPLISILNYYPNEKCQFHVLDKRSGKLLDVKFSTQSFLVLHHVNTYEDDGHLVVDLCAYRDDGIMKCFLMDEIKKLSEEEEPNFSSGSKPSELWRFVLPLVTEKYKQGHNLVMLDYTTATAFLETDGTVSCHPQIFSECVIEMPQISTAVAGKRYRYCYGITMKGNLNPYQTKLIKFDIYKMKATIWEHEKYIPGEPIFVQSPEAKEEDEGIILSPLINKANEESSVLLILDAATFKEISRAEIPSNIVVPPTFHGIFAEFEK